MTPADATQNADGERSVTPGRAVTRACTDGFDRVLRATWLIVGLWLSTLLVALPGAVILHGLIADHLGGSLMADQAAVGVNFDWWNEFLAQAAGIGQTFVPAIIGFAAVLKNLGGMADAQTLPPVLTIVVAAQIALSVFLAGGVLDRLARDRSIGAYGFFGACGVWFGRFLRLGLLAAAVYALLFTVVHPWLFDTLYPSWTRNLTVERTAFFVRAGLYLAFLFLLITVNMLFDYAKIRAVVEDRRSMIGALLAARRFVTRHPRQTLGLYACNATAFAVVAALYFLLAPGSASALAAFAVGQIYIVLRVMVRLQFVASQTSLFQHKLAHAGYVAAPVATWPDSPTVEAIKALDSRLKA